MKAEDLRKMAGNLERASHHNGPFGLKTRQGWWLTALSLDGLARHLEDEEKARGESVNWGQGEMVWDGEVEPPDFSRGAPTEDVPSEAQAKINKDLRDWIEMTEAKSAKKEIASNQWQWPWRRSRTG